MSTKTGQRHNRQLLETLGLPAFVSTPDLLNYVPQATWLPTLTDTRKWNMLPSPQLGERKLVVLHVPSRSVLKGTDYVSAAMTRLRDEGAIDYIEAQNIPYNEMSDLVSKVDLVVDQVSMGLYGVSAVEAMFGGRLVVAEVGDDIRRHIREETGLDLPIIEANPETIYQVVKDIASSPQSFLNLAEEGREFAEQVHSEARVARALSEFLKS